MVQINTDNKNEKENLDWLFGEFENKWSVFKLKLKPG